MSEHLKLFKHILGVLLFLTLFLYEPIQKLHCFKILDCERGGINIVYNKELYSGYLYLDFANYFADEGLDGFAHWYEIQAQEERDHAMMMICNCKDFTVIFYNFRQVF